MLNKIQIVLIVICFGLCAGLGTHYLLNKEDGKLIATPLRFEMPEGGVKTDNFSLRLFQEAVKQAPNSSIVISPALVSESLLELETLAAEPLKQVIAKQQIYTGNYEHTTVPPLSIIPAADYGLNFQNTPQEDLLIRLPFHANFPMALELFNANLVHNSGLPNQIIAHGKKITKKSRFVIGLAGCFSVRLHTPFIAANTRTDGFENADGSVPNVSMLRTRGNFRYTRDTEGKWEAVALPIHPDSYGNNIPTVLIAILPSGAAEKSALELTPDKLSHIRQSLLEAAPSDCSVSLPQMVYSPPLRDIRPLMTNLGLGALFDTTAKNWRFADQKLGIDAMVEKLHVSILPQEKDAGQQPRPENAATVLEFKRPFIWLIGDLSTAAPFYFMGLVQNL